MYAFTLASLNLFGSKHSIELSTQTKVSQGIFNNYKRIGTGLWKGSMHTTHPLCSLFYSTPPETHINLWALILPLWYTCFFFILYSPRLEHLISDSVFHLHLHQNTQATVANLLRFADLISYWSLTHPTPLTQIYLGWNHSDLKNNLTYQIYRYWLFFNKFKALFIYLILIYLLIHLFIYSCDHIWWQELKELKVNPLHKTVLFHSH